MRLEEVIDEIKLELTGNLLTMEIEDATLKAVVNKALRELERFWDESSFVTIPFSSCIDYTDTPLADSSSIVKIYRTDNFGESNVTAMADPAYAQQWMLFSNGGTMYNLNDYILNYASWTTLCKIKNTISTDLAFIEDKHNHKLYINNYMTKPNAITVEFIPKLNSVEDIQSDYWIDILIRLCVALTKITLGRIRTRFTQSNALWSQDGERLLDEGNTEYRELREILRTNSNLIYVID